MQNCGVHRQSEAATALWIESIKTTQPSKAPSPLRSAGALQSLLLRAFAVRARRVRLRRVVDFASLYDIGLIVELSAAVNVNLHYDLVRLSVMNIVRFECQ